jgi:hypothetical protein
MMIGILISEPTKQAAEGEQDAAFQAHLDRTVSDTLFGNELYLQYKATVAQARLTSACGRVIMFAVLLIPWVVLFRRLLGTPKPAHQIASPSPPQPPPNPPTPKPRVTMSRRP